MNDSDKESVDAPHGLPHCEAPAQAVKCQAPNSLLVYLGPSPRLLQGRWCYGKTPMQTFRDSVAVAKEKVLVA